jgi:hypothetical protein
MRTREILQANIIIVSIVRDMRLCILGVLLVCIFLQIFLNASWPILNILLNALSRIIRNVTRNQSNHLISVGALDA